MATVKPLTPADVHAQITLSVPDGVMEAWNEIIAENFSDGRSSFTRDELITRILQKMSNAGFKWSDVFDRGWLNMEAVFEKAGWDVNYDKPGFNESYDARFTLIPKRGYHD